MLKSIKSTYFTKILFLYLEEKQKLELIKYNKSLQENLNITLINYKNFSKRYIEYELNEKGKEFSFEGALLFEGEYLNGKKMEKEKNIMIMVN